MIPDTRYLRAFYAVCREGGVGRAAALLHLTQPAVTYQLRQLERELGVPLFERTGRHLALTAAGRELRAFCESFFREYSAVASVLGSGETGTGLLRISSVPGFGRYVLAPVIASLDLRATRVQVAFASAVDVFNAVESASCDVGFVYVPKVSSRLQIEPIYREELVLIAPPDAASDVRAAREASDFGAIEFVTYEEGDYVFGKWFSAVFGSQPKRVEGRFHFDELDEVVAYVSLGKGISIVPLDAAKAAIARGDVIVTRPKRARCYNPVYSVTRPSSLRHAALDALLAAIPRTR